MSDEITDDEKSKALSIQEMAKKYQPFLDALTAHVAVLDKAGNIVAVNSAWRNFAEENQGKCRSYEVGTNYIKLLEHVINSTTNDAKFKDDRNIAKHVIEGLANVMDGRTSVFEFVYPCHSSTEQRWFNLQITPLKDGLLSVVMSHDNVTPLKIAELQAAENAVIVISLFTETVRSIARAIESRDPYTAGHQRDVAVIANEIGKRLGLSDDVRYGLQLGATIHDIGKIAVPSEILSRPGSLNEHEYNLIKLHPKTGYDILKALDFPWPIAEMIYQHHERLDGSGYPRKLTTDFICLEAKIIAVADVYDAIISHRPYRAALARREAIRELTENSGILYDKNAVEALLDYISSLPVIYESSCD